MCSTVIKTYKTAGIVINVDYVDVTNPHDAVLGQTSVKSRECEDHFFVISS